MSDTGLPSLDALTNESTEVVIVITVDSTGTLCLHAFASDDVEPDMGDILSCAAELADSEDGFELFQ